MSPSPKLRQRAALLLAILGLVGCLFVTGSSHPALAATATSFSVESVGDQIGVSSLDLKQIIINIIRWALGLLTLVAVGYMIYGGYVWLTAGGNEQRVEKAKQIILQAAIGLVIVLMAWAIVLFIVKTTSNALSNNDGSGTPPCLHISDCPPPPVTTFNISSVTTCAVGPKFGDDVPRSSAVSIGFNTDIKIDAVLPSDPVYLAVTGGKLKIEQCTSSTCAAIAATADVVPTTMPGQVYTPGTATTGTATTPKSEWLVVNNTLNFYHLSFTDGPGNNFFKANTTYRLSIPKGTDSNALIDVRNRVLTSCKQDNSDPIIGDPGIDGNGHCDDTDAEKITYTFTTGSDTVGPPMTTQGTSPNSEYKTKPALYVDRNVDRSAKLSITFSSGIDPISATPDNFRVYEITGTPDDLTKGTCGGGECLGAKVTQVDPSKFDIRTYGGTTAYLQFKNPGEFFKPYSWYKAVAENIRNLCGTAAPYYYWTFETNNTTPGVDFVYPDTGAPPVCPTTQVFAQFKTSMWDITKGSTCEATRPSSYSTEIGIWDQDAATPSYVTSRTLAFSDPPPSSSADPNAYCKHLSFDPAAVGLIVDHHLSGAVKANRVVDADGNLLNYGDTIGTDFSGGVKPWNFSIGPPTQCTQPPYITDISPSEDKNGACVSINGDYFEKPIDTVAGLPDPGDLLTFDTLNQVSSTLKSWTKTSIVNKLDAGSLAVDQPHDYQVGVNYPAPISRVLLSNKKSFTLRAGGPDRPCLYSLNPDAGSRGTRTTATGEKFGGRTGLAAVQSDNHGPWALDAATGSWMVGPPDVIKNVVVPAPATQPRMSKVWVVNAAGTPSNRLDFNVTDPGTGVPAVIENGSCNAVGGVIPSPNPYKTDTQACTNSEITVRFTEPMEPSTFTTGAPGDTMNLYSCAAGTCSVLVPATVSVSGITAKLLPTSPLLDDTQYEVRITTGVTAAIPPTSSGKPLAAPYVWQFTTKIGACAISNVALNPSGTQTVTVANYSPVGLAASAIDDACHTLAHPGLQFTWNSSNLAVGEIVPDGSTPTVHDNENVAPPTGGATIGSTNVTVEAQSHTSNTFTLTYSPTGPGGSMDVEESGACSLPSTIPNPNPYRGDAAACRNGEISVRFTQPVDAAALVMTPTSIQLFECPLTGPCPGILVPTDANVVGKVITLQPLPVGTLLGRNTRYEVRLTTDIKAAPLPLGNGKTLSAPYSWQFTTLDSDALCVIDNVTTTPTGLQTVNRSDYMPVPILALTTDNACHTLTHTGLTFDWSSSFHAVGVIDPLPESGPADAKSLAPPTPNPPGATAIGTTKVKVTVQSHTSPEFSLQYDPVACVTSADCATNSLGEACDNGTPADPTDDSRCVNNKCTPVINALDKDRGPVGTWTTIKGCWFGSYDATRSKVFFYNEKEGVIPSTVLCGNTWTNERIIREVPNLTTGDNATTGKVRVERNDSAQITSVMDFTVGGLLEPGLCKINPNTGAHNSLTTVYGRSFGTKAAGDNVTFTPASTSTPIVPVVTYPSPPGWQDTSIPLRVPPTAIDGDNDVRVVKGTLSSNSVPYTIDDGASACTTTRCFFGDDSPCSAGTACSYPDSTGLGCCLPRPRVTTVAPPVGSTAQCRNTSATVTFNQTLDSATVNNRTVRYLDGARVANGGISHVVSAGKSTISYDPGLLTENTTQRYVLNPVSETDITSTVQNPSFDLSAAGGLPSNWTVDHAAQSTSIAPGSKNSCLNGDKAGLSCAADNDCEDAGGTHTCIVAHSVLADCATDAGCTEAHATQSLPTVEPLNTQLRVTGWVKVEQTSGSDAGLITECSLAGCGYDLAAAGPGIFRSTTNGWQYVDFVVKKNAIPGSRLVITCTAKDGAKVWCDDIQVSRRVDQLTTLRALNGVLADISYPVPATEVYNHTFSTGTNICLGDHVGITPVDDLFLAKNETHPDAAFPSYPTYVAGLYPSNSTAPINAVTGKYEFSWAWQSGNPAVAQSTAISAPTVSTNLARVVANGNGTTQVTAKAKVTLDAFSSSVGRTFSGSSNVTVNFCVDPWVSVATPGFTDSDSNCDTQPSDPSPTGCGDYNFKLFYCRNTGTTLLPDFTYGGASGVGLGSIEGRNDPQKRLKAYFFKESATSRDVIGIQIFANPDFLSPYDWFHRRFPLDTSGSSTTVNGYPAVRSGTATYIGVTNFTGLALEGLMFDFDYNSNNASPETVSIANQMLENMAFNTNVPSAADKQRLIDDTRRRQDMMSMKIQLDEYQQQNGSYPSLSAGSYVAGFSTSKWPSWQSTYGTALGSAAPTDPTNIFGAACNTPYEAATCWAESTKTFAAPADSFIYAYRNFSPDRSVIYGQMEYTGLGTFATGGSWNSINACTGLPASVPVTTCPTFNFCLEVGTRVDSTCTHP